MVAEHVLPLLVRRHRARRNSPVPSAEKFDWRLRRSPDLGTAPGRLARSRQDRCRRCPEARQQGSGIRSRDMGASRRINVGGDMRIEPNPGCARRALHRSDVVQAIVWWAIYALVTASRACRPGDRPERKDRDSSDDVDRIVEMVRSWTPRKGRMFTERHIRNAWGNLRDKGWMTEAVHA